MLSKLLPAPLVGVLTFALMAVWLATLSPLLLSGVVLKALAPVPLLRRLATRYLIAVADLWVAGDGVIYRCLQDVRWQINIDGHIDPRLSYLLVCNHQSWADIMVLCDAFHGRTFFPRFFLKQQLIWVPIIGVVCWGLDMPFMKRHSAKAIARNPKLRDEDLRATRRFCEKYRQQPISIVMFPEGTRYNQDKHRNLESPYRHLLKPKAGGLAFTLDAMGEQFAGVIDISVAYQPPPPGQSLLWSWLCGRQSNLIVQAQVQPVPEVAGVDRASRKRFQNWVNDLWANKDEQLDRLKARTQADAPVSTSLSRSV